MDWQTSCPDWEKKIVAGQSLIPCEPLFKEQAEYAIEQVFKELIIADVAGSPKIKEITRQWVYDFVGAIFGSYNQETGERLIKEYFLLISKKNSKSTIAAGIMLTALILNWRESAEFLIIAPTKEIAENSFIPARDMIRLDSKLTTLFQVSEHTRTITHRVSKATLKVVAAETDTVGGKKATAILVDELWLFGKKANAENMFREAFGGLLARPEGFIIYLTTQSDEAPAGVFKQKLTYARNVRDGVIEDKQFLPLIYEFPKSYLDENLHLDPDNFYITNPNLGASVDKPTLERWLKQAQEGGNESLRGFLAKHLNVEIGLNLRSNRWSGADFWERQATKLSLDDLIERSETITVGIDGGGLDDMLGLAVLGRETKTRKWLLWNHAWLHESALEQRKQLKPRFSDFEKQGDLTICQDSGQDLREIGELILRLFKSRKLYKVGLDPAKINALLDAMIQTGTPEDYFLAVSQGWRLTGDILTTERRLAEKVLFHSGSEMMAWCVGNARVETKGNGIMITKQTSGSAKIDPLIATFNAVSLMCNAPEVKTHKIYFI